MNWDNTPNNRYKKRNQPEDTSLFFGIIKIALGIAVGGSILWIIDVAATIGFISAIGNAIAKEQIKTINKIQTIYTPPKPTPHTEINTNWRQPVPQVPLIAPASDPRKTIIYPASNGSYWINGIINKIPVVFKVDTGADRVDVPIRLAVAAGLPFGKSMQWYTASDKILVYETTIPLLSFDKITLYNIPATINPRSPRNDVLLGMTALRHVNLTQENGRLTLSHPGEVRYKDESPFFARSLEECSKHTGVIDDDVLKCLKGIGPPPITQK